jgi:hypothetical protein
MDGDGRFSRPLVEVRPPGDDVVSYRIDPGKRSNEEPAGSRRRQAVSMRSTAGHEANCP